jgi:hypothetical protein
MTYTFKYSNSFTNLSFEILDDPSGIISGISLPTATSGTGSSTQNFSVTFSSSVESIVYGSTATARIAATYVDNTSTQKIAYIDVVAKDEICCAYVLGSDGRCYRLSTSKGGRYAKPSCPSGWVAITAVEVASRVDKIVWYYTIGANIPFWTNPSTQDNYFAHNNGLYWYVSDEAGTDSLPIACVQ